MINRSLHISLILCLSLLGCTSVLSQNKTSVSAFINQTPALNSDVTSGVSSNKNVSLSKTVQIQQVGQNNSVNTNIVSVINKTDILQFGEKNDIFQGIIAGKVKNTIVQSGYDNNIVHVNTTKSRAHTATVIQYGLRQNLVWIGDNSISQNMVIRMKGKKQTVLVRNRK
ncbi:hypothetical protein G5B37_13475 [Rasiella rasia]|uniref:Lipoprotein n=1 Tax=Rasiella rasia TaxID=2744027 RepID=A0A6G6GPS0_9FLAO|nr:hypothetical protein [Rasiella rasia]QIE60537.1 hypothetical protein G5B37_13475 [Rasiella rasia]